MTRDLSLTRYRLHNHKNSHWDLLNYLPAALRHPFDFIIATFLADHLREARSVPSMSLCVKMVCCCRMVGD